MSVLRRVQPPRAKNNWLLRHGSNVTSQCGEDGVIEKIFETIPMEEGQQQRWCVEFGAWDGFYLSNTWNLLNNQEWSGVMLEADPLRFAELQRRYLSNPNVFCINELVTFEGERSLDSLLMSTPLPEAFDLLSIDVDGNDYHVWDTLHCFKPRVVVIEYNPTIPSSVVFIQERDMSVFQGSSLLALVELGKSKGYELTCVTTFNAIFVLRQYYPLFQIEDNSLHFMRDFPMESQLFQLYDGTLVLTGCKKLLWHKVAISHKALQVLPPGKRKFPFAPPQHTSTALYKARLLYMACLQRYADVMRVTLSSSTRVNSALVGREDQSSSTAHDVAELVHLGEGLLPVPAHEEDGHEILGYALLLARHDKDLCISGPRRVAAIYERRADMENKNHGVKDGLRWYKLALYSLWPSGEENINPMVSLLCKIGAAYIALRAWNKSLFWLHLATTLDREDIAVWKQLERLHRKRGDKLSLENARLRVRELEMHATEATLLRVRALSPTLGIRPPKAPMDVISIDSQEGEQLERRRMMSVGTLQGTEDSGLTSFSNSNASTSSSNHTSGTGTTTSSDENHLGPGEWNGDIGVDRNTMVSTSALFGVDFTVDSMIDSDYREREKAIIDLKLILAEREEELRQSTAKSTKFYRIAIGTTCMGGVAVCAAIVLLVRPRGMSRS